MDALSLAVFVEAVSVGSLAGAARRLGIEALAASRGLAALERQLGVRLMQRSTRSLSLTPEGEIFLPHAQALLEAEAAALASVSPRAGEAVGLLRVTASAAFGRKVLVPFAARFMPLHPELKLDVLMTDRVVDLVGEGLDLAIRIAPLPDSQLIARQLAASPRLLVAAPGYLAARGAPAVLDDLSAHECLCLSGQTHWSFRRQEVAVAHRVAGRFTASSIEGVLQACLGGMGIALMSEWAVRDELAAGALVPLPLRDAVAEALAISAVYPSRRLVPAKVRLFIEALRGELLAGDSKD